MQFDNVYTGEHWKPVVIKGFPLRHKYDVSNLGRIRRYDKKLGQYKILKVAQVKGYPIYSFWGKETRRTALIHRLVSENFVEREYKSQNYVIHLDFNKSNNRADNLKWVTRETMIQHMKINPNWDPSRPRNLNNAKLTETEVIRLKKKLKRGKTALYKIAREFGITHTQLNRIRRGENWGHIKID